MGNTVQQKNKPSYSNIAKNNLSKEKSISITSRRSANAYKSQETSIASQNPDEIHLSQARHTYTSHSQSLKPYSNKRESILIDVHNGITGTYISSKICKIAAMFWKKHIDNLSHKKQIEVGCAIFFGMSVDNKNMRSILKSVFRQAKIETISVKYLDMMGWLMRYLITDGVELYPLLTKLGSMHQKMGINITHFDPMLQAMHDTFSYYFDTEYSLDIKYAMDEIFTLAAQIMTGQDLKCATHLNNITKQFKDQNIPFLHSLDVCLKSSIGKEYLYRYLSQTWCDEITIFFKSLSKFKNAVSDKERFMIARDITKISIQPSAIFALNLSFEHRTNATGRMAQLEVLFLHKKTFLVASDFFDEVEHETIKLLRDNHWKKFSGKMKTLQLQSSHV